MQKVKEHTSSGPERLTGLMNAVRYLVENKIPGDFVECGVSPQFPDPTARASPAKVKLAKKSLVPRLSGPNIWAL